MLLLKGSQMKLCLQFAISYLDNTAKTFTVFSHTARKFQCDGSEVTSSHEDSHKDKNRNCTKTELQYVLYSKGTNTGQYCPNIKSVALVRSGHLSGISRPDCKILRVPENTSHHFDIQPGAIEQLEYWCEVINVQT